LRYLIWYTQRYVFIHGIYTIHKAFKKSFKTINTYKYWNESNKIEIAIECVIAIVIVFLALIVVEIFLKSFSYFC